LAKYNITDSFNLELGPQIGFLVSAKEKSGGNTTDMKDATKSTDFSLVLGAGYGIGSSVVLDARYNFGLTQLQKDLGSGESASKNSVFQFSVGYKF
jgi:hypothetical protein